MDKKENCDQAKSKGPHMPTPVALMSVRTGRPQPDLGIRLIAECNRGSGITFERTSTQVKFLGDLTGVLASYDEGFIGKLMLRLKIEHRQVGLKTMFALSDWERESSIPNFDCMLISESGEYISPVAPRRPQGLDFAFDGTSKTPLIGMIPGLEEWLTYAIYKVGSLFRHGRQSLATANELATAISLCGYASNVHDDDIAFVCNALELRQDFKVTEKQSSVAYCIEPILAKKPKS